jgi:Protein chain release factor A
MSERRRVLSVTIHDCEVQHFRSGGKGGQNQNKRDTGTRIIHHPSGARGESREERSQLQNKRAAFLRMIETPRFRVWMARELGQSAVWESEYQIPKEEVRIEIKVGGRWTMATEEQLT